MASENKVNEMEIGTSSSLPLGARRRRTDHDANVPEMTPNQIAEASRASVNEHRMKLSDAGRTYKKALFWSAIMGMVSPVIVSATRNQSIYQATRTLIESTVKTIVMESYDQILIGSFYALPAFQKTFGFDTGNGSYQVSAPWQSALSKTRPESF